MAKETIANVLHREMQKLNQNTEIPPWILKLIEKLSLPILNLFPETALAIHYLGKSINLILQVFKQLQILRLAT